MELPRVNPVGIVEYPSSFTARPRRLPWPMRAAAIALLAVFAAVGSVTTAATLGRYCLTSHASSAAPLQPR